MGLGHWCDSKKDRMVTLTHSRDDTLCLPRTENVFLQHSLFNLVHVLQFCTCARLISPASDAAMLGALWRRYRYCAAAPAGTWMASSPAFIYDINPSQTHATLALNASQTLENTIEPVTALQALQILRTANRPTAPSKYWIQNGADFDAWMSKHISSFDMGSSSRRLGAYL